MFSEPSRTDIHKLFDRIACRYDIFNRISSFGMDTFWRRRLAKSLRGGKGLNILDAATGTGDLLLSLFDLGCDISSAVGIDTSGKMLTIAARKTARRNLAGKITLKQADAVDLPFTDSQFGAVTCAFGVRNFTDSAEGLKQMHRVLKPAGKLLILEFSIPSNRVIKMFYLVYLRFIIPVLGKIITGDFNAYRYLSKTIQTFPSGEDFCRQMQKAGFADVREIPMTFGVVTLYSGVKS
ncbi:MAG: bifunctional demethylmenaquinone methyltransferase/2-methoxy-6-polyprenyl-1,4-benzoquinol methylase UbiE [Phycisphaerae bacterium]|jgi:demethylmenaquinone methyltransferase/2-methoxy-6-polyprenyl-1,4-benzoquinol methylase